MPKQANEPLLSREHYTIFGLIIQEFAEIENLFQMIMAHISKASRSAVTLMTVGLSYAQKRESLLALIRIADLTDDQKQQIRCILGEIHKHNAMRNWIAHSQWVPGARIDSFKPMQMKIRGELHALGIGEDEQDYILDDLQKIALDLNARKNELIKLLLDAGYLTDDIEVNTPASNSDTSSSPGKPSAR